MFSLCIPTMNRYDTFLKGFLKNYKDNYRKKMNLCW